ncbi:L-serine ammonia-lyase, iron-sulfur-dependent, subunit alpha [Hydrogenoanaerobacterium sp.]|uniref:L-cysteine desulfidase family protein n=1 Tax=Hydrogenoanaerobacterium sp. TaxID=2953763 RepID=UPI0028A04A44|nr:L-serine ammonia-lyase, iron-sulfur-dependent, subunit alpha [Hydrogenoanaerobacterium sp.]
MSLSKEKYLNYVSILKEELIPALGCTEPIAIAYAAAKARNVLGVMPDRIVAECSGNIIKNVKGVIVPTTKDLRGIEAAAIIGAVGGDPAKELEVLTGVTQEHLAQAKALIQKGICEEKILETPAKLHIIIRMFHGDNSSMVEIIHTHTGIVRIEKNDEVLLDVPHSQEENFDGQTDRSCLNVEDIVEFANTVNVDDIREVLAKQVEYNTAISNEGLHKIYGANIGITLLSTYGDDVKIRAKAAAAAGSDARMGGCEMPVVINSGSGNQGMTVSLPVIEYAKELSVTTDRLYRALCVSNLIAIHQKTKIGRLSAYCGAVSAATGAGAAITYLYGGGVKEISQTITSTLANVSGIVCDGAKPSCAAKIASSVDAALLACYMTMQSRGFNSGEGIVKDGVEETIDSVSRLAKDGMQVTDEEILKIMING